MAESWEEMRASYSYILQGFGSIQIGNIPPQVTPRRLKIYFETFGPVENLSIRQTRTQYSTYQYGFVTFKKESDAKKALSDPHHSVHFEGIKVNPVKRGYQPVEDRMSILDLNDDCLIKIASKLSLVNLHQLSQVCQRFEYIVDFLFSKCENLDARVFSECTLMEIREIMSKVGPFLQKVKFSGKDIVDEKTHFLDCLTEFCSNLRILECRIQGRNHEVLSNMFQAFKNFTVLSLYDCEVTDKLCKVISNCENIENLNLSHNGEITGKYLHKLIKLKILNLRSCPNLQSLHFNELMANVKLEFLNIEHCDSLNSSSIEHLLRHQTELVTLCVTKKNNYSSDLYPLAKSKSLKNLQVCVDDSDSILEELAFHNTGVEKLKITCGIREMQLKATQKQAISNLKNLKELCIEGIDDSFIKQIASRTSLRHLCCAGCYNVSSDGILDSIRISNTIEQIGISSLNKFYDELFFNAIDILKKKQRATRLTFEVCSTRFRTNKNIQMVNKFLRKDLENYKFW